MKKHTILSPLPGTFYRSPSPESPPFKNDGEDVSAGDTIGLVEVMKNFHEIKSDITGSNISYNLENESLISPGDIIAEVESE